MNAATMSVHPGRRLSEGCVHLILQLQVQSTSIVIDVAISLCARRNFALLQPLLQVPQPAKLLPCAGQTCPLQRMHIAISTRDNVVRMQLAELPTLLD